MSYNIVLQDIVSVNKTHILLQLYYCVSVPEITIIQYNPISNLYTTCPEALTKTMRKSL